jgi:sigma-B regulation protein RsbU (phosphoserine phosphatase)
MPMAEVHTKECHMKVLTVDDNPMTGLLLADTLRDLGHEPLVAESAAAAMEIFDRQRPDVCILDWMMPGGDGLQLACDLRKHPHGQAVYIIMLSSKQDAESIGLAYGLAVDEFITKPVAGGELKARLHAAGRLVALRDQVNEKCNEVASLAAEVARLRAAA